MILYIKEMSLAVWCAVCLNAIFVIFRSYVALGERHNLLTSGNCKMKMRLPPSFITVRIN